MKLHFGVLSGKKLERVKEIAIINNHEIVETLSDDVLIITNSLKFKIDNYTLRKTDSYGKHNDQIITSSSKVKNEFAILGYGCGDKFDIDGVYPNIINGLLDYITNPIKVVTDLGGVNTYSWEYKTRFSIIDVKSRKYQAIYDNLLGKTNYNVEFITPEYYLDKYTPTPSSSSSAIIKIIDCDNISLAIQMLKKITSIDDGLKDSLRRSYSRSVIFNSNMKNTIKELCIKFGIFDYNIYTSEYKSAKKIVENAAVHLTNLNGIDHKFYQHLKSKL